MTNPNERKQNLQQEAVTRRATLERLRSQLAADTRDFRLSRTDADGRAVTDMAARVRLAEIALDGVLEEIETLSRPRRIAITDSRATLGRGREQIRQRLAYARKQHDEQVELERRRCGYKNPEWVQRHLRNVYRGDPERVLHEATTLDRQRLEHIEAQLEELDRRETQNNQPPSAA